MAHFTRKWSPADALLLDEVMFLQDLVSSGVLELPVILTPDIPAAGYGKFYVRDDGSGNSAPFFMSDDGTEIQLGAGEGGGSGSIISAENSGDDQTYTLSATPSSERFVIMNNGSYSSDDLSFPYSIIGTTLVFDNPLPADLADTLIKVVSL